MTQEKRILLLDNRLANQIAAGEVVERPASVVKELVENCIDAGASRIEVDIERGGARLIRIIDNGCGINKADLMLALTRHATSKISTTEDLANIRSLGFRGEALASISAVSRLTLTSRQHGSEQAWQAIAQGRDMAVEILPAAAAPGTRIEVADLFFNTPARQKFLRTEKTEFNHIEEVVKSHALANFQIAFMLKHNLKVIKRIPACGEPSQQALRIAAICGKPFIDNAIRFSCQHDVLMVEGWIGRPGYHRSESDIQYVFINRRPVKDKTLNHAIRQAYEGLLPAGRMATYVIYLTVDPAQVDVNVHPTKHEVRFSEQRLVHDLLAKSVRDALVDDNQSLGLLAQADDQDDNRQINLNQSNASPIEDAEKLIKSDDKKRELSMKSTASNLAGHSSWRNNHTASAYRSPAHKAQKAAVSETVKSYLDQYFSTLVTHKPATKPASLAENDTINEAEKTTPSMQLGATQQFDRKKDIQSTPVQGLQASSSDFALWHLQADYWIYKQPDNLWIVNARQLLLWVVRENQKKDNAIETVTLLFPQSLPLNDDLLEDCAVHQLLEEIGFDFNINLERQIVLRKIPNWLKFVETSVLVSRLSTWLLQLQLSKAVDENLQQLVQLTYDNLPTDLVKQLLEDCQLSESVQNTPADFAHLENSDKPIIKKLALADIRGLFS
ncbi:DNA mismatch repair endonuclease MutL [Aliikangiella maris]|uniref:DNA mismatch repair protein MutL n=2 Tax=Aliikangiella maris TaxID=3162458 RepID=A0ABV3MQ75_9GAMM